MTDLEITDLRNKIINGLDISIQRLIKDKRMRSQDLVVSKNGKVIHIKASEM